MPRQRRGSAAPARSAPSRPTVAPGRPNVTPPQQTTRPTSTATHQSPAAVAAQKPGTQSSGLFGQMASTAAGVAVGSSIGHAIGGFFGGSTSPQSAASAAVDSAEPTHAQNGFDEGRVTSRSCDVDAKALTRCLDENRGSEYQMSLCGWYLEELKACQQAASQY